jgi:hypothetical protein
MSGIKQDRLPAVLGQRQQLVLELVKRQSVRLNAKAARRHLVEQLLKVAIDQRLMAGEMDDTAPHHNTFVKGDINATPMPQEEAGDGLPNMRYRLRVICAAVLVSLAIWTTAFLLLR